MFGIVVIGLAIYLVYMSDARGPLTFALLAPPLAGLLLFIRKTTRVSPAVMLLSVAVLYAVLSVLMGSLTSRISWHLYGNYTLTGRTLIWDFVNYEIARRPLLGWGYQSFWFVGPDAPSVVDAPGWIKSMPSAHNGYLDTIVDLGYVGLVLLVIFIFATVHAIRRVADQDPQRGWLLLTVALYVILTNFIESKWMTGYNRLWLLFLFTAVETARYTRYLPSPATFGPLHRPPAKKSFSSLRIPDNEPSPRRRLVLQNQGAQ
jgi:exopolysaccharide production protein ExoQ